MTGYSGALEITLFYIVIGAILSVPVVFLAWMLRARRRARRADAASAAAGGAPAADPRRGATE